MDMRLSPGAVSEYSDEWARLKWKEKTIWDWHIMAYRKVYIADMGDTKGMTIRGGGRGKDYLLDSIHEKGSRARRPESE